MEKYVPPYDVTEEMLELASEITEELGKLGNVTNLDRLPRLRRVNRIMSIQSSLAIENNTLSLSQVTDVIDGKHVLGPQDDILAVKNAFAAYKTLPELDPFSLSDLKKAHGVMMNGLTQRAGAFRTSSVGVFNEQGKAVHIAPPHDMVGGLMEQLFDWLKTSKTHMLIRSSIFHYEFEFIHPFTDGNGRTGRLWQTALLASLEADIRVDTHRKHYKRPPRRILSSDRTFHGGRQIKPFYPLYAQCDQKGNVAPCERYSRISKQYR